MEHKDQDTGFLGVLIRVFSPFLGAEVGLQFCVGDFPGSQKQSTLAFMSKPGAIPTYGHTGLIVKCSVPARFCHVLIL